MLRASGGRAHAIGTPLRIISADREAELSFLGVATYHAGRREWVMVDLGGGSTEVVFGHSRKMLRSATLPIGSGVLASTYFSDPPRPEERARLLGDVERRLPCRHALERQQLPHRLPDGLGGIAPPTRPGRNVPEHGRS